MADCTLDVVKAAAEHHGVCIRPVVREVVDLDTGEVRIVAVRCNSTQASKCQACADRNRKFRMAQCREGWHLEQEPVAEREAPSADQVELVTYRSDLTAEYRKAAAEGALDQVDDLREAIREADADLRGEVSAATFHRSIYLRKQLRFGPLADVRTRPICLGARSTSER
ncbi:hypothetical protein BBK82_08540 [Lentzea guizhouensis]|uniref:Uncharacterized protein n=1 Tax=Lentzea guizhouensis TaxID=1586287 RepID=A0A1B2HEH2_9PSEU|nr:hypothetical protein BBK82_08540 [Lentzea guizhouensis]